MQPPRRRRAAQSRAVRGAQGVKLSKKEARELEYKRRVYELAVQRKATEDALQQRDEYHLPDSYEGEGARSQRYEVLTARYRRARPAPPPPPSHANNIARVLDMVIGFVMSLREAARRAGRRKSSHRRTVRAGGQQSEGCVALSCTHALPRPPCSMPLLAVTARALLMPLLMPAAIIVCEQGGLTGAEAWKGQVR